MNPKMAERVAKTYIQISKMKGKKEADLWARAHCGENKEHLTLVAQQVAKLSKKA